MLRVTLNIDLGVLCMDDDEEMQERCGPQCWYGIDADPGGFLKTMWLDVMRESNCKAVSTLSSCDDRRERAFTQQA